MMNKRHLTAGLAAVVLFQIAVLAVEYLNSVYPLWTGQEIRLETRPVDPRSLFRGNYARLSYRISQIDWSEIGDELPPRFGEVVYVTLKPGINGLHIYDRASLEKPDEGLFIQGRFWKRLGTTPANSYQVRYGIEAYFTSPENAIALQTDLRRGGVAIVMVASNGKAALKEVIGGRGVDQTEIPANQ